MLLISFCFSQWYHVWWNGCCLMKDPGDMQGIMMLCKFCSDYRRKMLPFILICLNFTSSMQPPPCKAPVGKGSKPESWQAFHLVLHILWRMKLTPKGSTNKQRHQEQIGFQMSEEPSLVFNQVYDIQRNLGSFSIWICKTSTVISRKEIN